MGFCNYPVNTRLPGFHLELPLVILVSISRNLEMFCCVLNRCPWLLVHWFSFAVSVDHYLSCCCDFYQFCRTFSTLGVCSRLTLASSVRFCALLMISVFVALRDRFAQETELWLSSQHLSRIFWRWRYLSNTFLSLISYKCSTSKERLWTDNSGRIRETQMRHWLIYWSQIYFTQVLNFWMWWKFSSVSVTCRTVNRYTTEVLLLRDWNTFSCGVCWNKAIQKHNDFRQVSFDCAEALKDGSTKKIEWFEGGLLHLCNSPTITESVQTDTEWNPGNCAFVILSSHDIHNVHIPQFCPERKKTKRQ